MSENFNSLLDNFRDMHTCEASGNCPGKDKIQEYLSALHRGVSGEGFTEEQCAIRLHVAECRNCYDSFLDYQSECNHIELLMLEDMVKTGKLVDEPELEPEPRKRSFLYWDFGKCMVFAGLAAADEDTEETIAEGRLGDALVWRVYSIGSEAWFMATVKSDDPARLSGCRVTVLVTDADDAVVLADEIDTIEAGDGTFAARTLLGDDLSIFQDARVTVSVSPQE